MLRSFAFESVSLKYRTVHLTSLCRVFVQQLIVKEFPSY